jgi:hypothetical protein
MLRFTTRPISSTLLARTTHVRWESGQSGGGIFGWFRKRNETESSAESTKTAPSAETRTELESTETKAPEGTPEQIIAEAVARPVSSPRTVTGELGWFQK